MALASVRKPAMVEVAQKARVVDGGDRSDAHRAGRELPEIRRKPGMRIGAKSRRIDLLPVAFQLVLAEPPLEKGAGVDPGRRMRLKKDEIAARPGVGAEKMVEAGLENLGGGSEAG